MVHVKICGITRPEDALLATDLGASALGFVFWTGSPRFIDPYRAKRIVEMLPPMVTPIGVFVDQPIDYVGGVADLVRLGAVQLHGHEAPEYYAQLGHRVIKAIAVTQNFRPEDALDLPRRVTLLLDAHDPVLVGGTGKTIDWSVAAAVATQRRVLLSGGLRPDTVAAAIEAVRPYGVDVSSGVEARPGVKDARLLQAFFDAVRQSEQRVAVQG